MEWSTERSSALQEAEMKRKNRPWWMWVLVAFLSVGILDAIIGDDGSNSPAAAPRAAATSARPAQTIGDARRAVEDDHYRAAIAIATAIGTREVDSIRKRIANRLAERVLSAVRAGERGRAKTLLVEARDYPMTTRMRQARARYKAAKALAAQRAQQRRQAADQRRRAEALKAVPEPKPQSNCDPNYEGACLDPTSADYDCAGGSGNGPDYTGPVRSVGSDPFDLDRDGDGLACENR
jgi:hypothetical protein